MDLVTILPAILSAQGVGLAQGVQWQIKLLPFPRAQKRAKGLDLGTMAEEHAQVDLSSLAVSALTVSRAKYDEHMPTGSPLKVTSNFLV